MRSTLKELTPDDCDSELEIALLDALDALHEVEERDRELRGSTPEDALMAHIENTDECPNCGDELDEGGWCSFGCMQADLGDSDE